MTLQKFLFDATQNGFEVTFVAATRPVLSMLVTKGGIGTSAQFDRNDLEDPQRIERKLTELEPALETISQRHVEPL